jgi:hypothetical protein
MSQRRIVDLKVRKSVRPMTYKRFSNSVEAPQPNEEEMSEEILSLMLGLAQSVSDRHRHAYRAVHAKSHGILKGEFIVDEGLPSHLAQGLFAKPAKYPVIIRLSTAPGDIQSDRNRAAYGFAIMVLGVQGEKILTYDKSSTQDFLLVNNPVIPFGDVHAYREMSRILAQSDGTPEGTARVISTIVPGTNPLLDRILKVLATTTSYNNLLGETFHTMAAIQYGEYIAKLSAAPESPELKALTGVPVDGHADFSAIRDFVVDFFHHHSVEYSVRAQLCTDLETMPVEDASILWPEEESAHQHIARIVIPKQEAYSPARRVYADELSFNPWHAITDHRPLGSIMRIRKKIYEESSRFRHGKNMQPIVEPTDISELPD